MNASTVRTAAIHGDRAVIVNLDTAAGLGLLRGADHTKPQAEHVAWLLRGCNAYAADRPRYSAGWDLALAAARLAVSDAAPAESITDAVIWGAVTPGPYVHRAGASLLVAEAARAAGVRRLIVAAEDAPEAALVSGIDVIPIADLDQLAGYLRGGLQIPPMTARPHPDPLPELPDLIDIAGLPRARLALEIAAAGGHRLLLHGAPGVGKTMLARRLSGLLPDLTEAQAWDVARVYSRTRAVHELPRRPPWRAPHHTVSVRGLAGDPQRNTPGETELATHGVLFVDELPEFTGVCRDHLQKPQRGVLLAAMNPCSCGYLRSPTRACVCSPSSVERYRQRIDPLLVSFDLAVNLDADTGDGPRESTSVVRERVRRAIERRERRQGYGSPLTPAAAIYLNELHLPARRNALIRVAQTVADLAADVDADPFSPIHPEHLATAVSLYET